MRCEDCEKLGIIVEDEAEEGYRYCWLCLEGYKVQWQEERDKKSLWAKLFNEPFSDAIDDFFNQLRLEAPKDPPAIPPKPEEPKNRLEPLIKVSSSHTIIEGLRQVLGIKSHINIEFIDDLYTDQKVICVTNTKTNKTAKKALPYIYRNIEQQTILSGYIREDIVEMIDSISSSSRGKVSIAPRKRSARSKAVKKKRPGPGPRKK